jgi:hypothetical protein
LMVRAGLPGVSTASNGLRNNDSFMFPARESLNYPGMTIMRPRRASSPECSGAVDGGTARDARLLPAIRDCRFYSLASRVAPFHN